MAVRRYKKNTAGRRNSSVDAFSDITTSTPHKPLLKIRKKHAGRTGGKITVRHRGGGAKRQVRMIDWKQNKVGVPGTVKTVEYDPNRGARVGLISYADGDKRYILLTNGLKVGDKIMTTDKKGGADIKNGNRMPLAFIPAGMVVSNVELDPGHGGQMVRGAGNGATLMAIEGKYATLKLPSGEVRKVIKDCMATIGQVSNPDRRLIRWGKAGRTRHRGFRPTVRGKAMNPVDHPHGGGEGSNPIGLKHPKTPTGKPALGVKTRRKRPSDALILERRGKKRRK